MTLWGALAGGFVGSLVVGAGVDAAAWLRLTRLDIPLVLGTAVLRDRMRARAAGYAAHLLIGVGSAAVYAAAGATAWGIGALAGLVHGVVAATVVYPVLLPAASPRMSLRRDPGRAVLEAPGALMLAYGRATPLVLLALHVVYGTLVGGFAAMAG